MRLSGVVVWWDGSAGLSGIMEKSLKLWKSGLARLGVSANVLACSAVGAGVISPTRSWGIK